jgi:hypothetical protein
MQTESKTTTPLPCPFCGEPAEFILWCDNPRGKLGCNNNYCTALPAVVDYVNEEALIAAWNTRKP